MQLLNTRSNYGIVSRGLHWIIVFAIVAQWAFAEAFEAMSLHKSAGLAVMLLAILRVAWLAFNPAPAWPADIKPFEVVLARAVYVGFYVLLFAIPLSGWALASVEDEPLRFFNVFDVPRLVLGSEESLEEVHEALFNVLSGLAVLHVIGAFKHWMTRRTSGARPA